MSVYLKMEVDEIETGYSGHMPIKTEHLSDDPEVKCEIDCIRDNIKSEVARTMDHRPRQYTRGGVHSRRRQHCAMEPTCDTVPGPQVVRRKTPKLSVSTTDHEHTLVPLFNQGMKSYAKDNTKAQALINSACERTGLSNPEIKRWIDNYKKKIRDRHAPRKKTPVRRKRGVDIFMTEKLKRLSAENPTCGTRERLLLANESWRNLPKEEKVGFTEQARNTAPPPTSLGPCAQLKKSMRVIKKEIQLLEEAGVMGILALIVDHEGNYNALGTEKCVDWWTDQSSAQYCFMATCLGETPVKHDPNRELRQEVQALFNTKYREASGTSKRCSYKAVDAGRLSGIGFPSGVQLKKPSVYGKPALEAILAVQDEISFVITEGDHGDVQVLRDHSYRHLNNTHRHLNNTIPNGGDPTSIPERLARGGASRRVGNCSEVSHGTQYTIDKLVGKNEHRGHTLYEVKWAGHSQAEETWEPVNNLSSDKVNASKNKVKRLTPNKTNLK